MTDNSRAEISKNQKGITLSELQKRIGQKFASLSEIFRGMTLAGISINAKLVPSDKYPAGYFEGVDREKTRWGISNLSATVIIPNEVIREYAKRVGGELPERAKYDILIDKIALSKAGRLQIHAKGIKETGVSDRELMRRRLEAYCKKRGYFERPRRKILFPVTSVLAITTEGSTIHDDICSNLNLSPESVRIVKCSSPKEIARNILSALENDIVVLYRGGREDEAMAIFSDEVVLDAIAQASVPVCAALGHEIDIPFVYRVADATFSTPSAFGKEITQGNQRVHQRWRETIRSIARSLASLKETAMFRIEDEEVRMNATVKLLLGKALSSIRERAAVAERLHRVITTRLLPSKVEERLSSAGAAMYAMVEAEKRRVGAAVRENGRRAHACAVHEARRLEALAASIEEKAAHLVETKKRDEVLRLERRNKRTLAAVLAAALAVLAALLTYLLLR